MKMSLKNICIHFLLIIKRKILSPYNSLRRLKLILKETHDNLSKLEAKIDTLESKINYIAKNHSTNTKKKILFLIHNINTWHALSQVIINLKKDNSFEVIVASINKKFPGQDIYSGEDTVHCFLDNKNIDHIRLGMSDSYQSLDIILTLAPDVIFRQSQWDADYPPAFSSKNLNFTRLAFIPYEIANTIKIETNLNDIKDFGVDSLFHRQCWRVYCSSEYIKKNATKNGTTNGKQFHVVGHPKIDYLEALNPKWFFRERIAKRILWSPHHSISTGWADFGLFPSVWKDIISLASEWLNVDFVFCPHPALVTLLESNKIHIDDFHYDSFINDLDNRENFFCYFGADYAELAASCDVILTDGISLLLEGQFLNKNIVFLERKDHVAFNNIGKELYDGLFKVDSITDAKIIIDKIFTNSIESLHRNQIANINKIFPNKNAARNIIEDLKKSL